MELDRYQLAFAIEKVDGYFSPRPHEHADREPAFLRARAECADHYRRMAETIELLEWSSFRAKTQSAKAGVQS